MLGCSANRKKNDCVFSPPYYFIFVTVLSYFYELYFICNSTVGVVIRPQAG